MAVTISTGYLSIFIQGKMYFPHSPIIVVVVRELAILHRRPPKPLLTFPYSGQSSRKHGVQSCVITCFCEFCITAYVNLRDSCVFGFMLFLTVFYSLWSNGNIFVSLDCLHEVRDSPRKKKMKFYWHTICFLIQLTNLADLNEGTEKKVCLLPVLTCFLFV